MIAMFNNIEQAYGAIAQILISRISSGNWKSLVVSCKILSLSAGRSVAKKIDIFDNVEPFSCGLDAGTILDAAVYLRDDILKTTGQRIWGLTFTLYPTGKFNIEYDYNKPDGYEETDETINLGDAVASLQNMVTGKKQED